MQTVGQNQRSPAMPKPETLTIDLSTLSPAVADAIRLLLSGDEPADRMATMRVLVELLQLVVGT
jgi:hypothetical protein